jgi:hypothetical protein
LAIFHQDLTIDDHMPDIRCFGSIDQLRIDRLRAVFETGGLMGAFHLNHDQIGPFTHFQRAGQVIEVDSSRSTDGR